MSETLRIVSYNVRYFSQPLLGVAPSERALEAIAAAIASLEPAPQIICLQEIEARSLRARAGGHGGLPLDRFVAALASEPRGARYRALYFPAHAGRIYCTGQAVLVDERQLTVARHACHPLSIHGDRGERRVCAHVELRTASRRALHVFNAHLALPSPVVTMRFGHGRNQLRQVQRLGELVHACASDAPFIVCGDFNSRPGSPVHRHLVEVEGLSSPDHHDVPTAGFARARRRLDYLFASSGIRWLDADGTRAFGDRGSPFHGLSDHVPLIARFAA